MLPNANVSRLSTLFLNAHSCASALASVIENGNKHQKICAFAESIVLYNTIVLHWEGCRLFFMHKCLSYILNRHVSIVLQFQICSALKLSILFVSINISSVLHLSGFQIVNLFL